MDTKQVRRQDSKKETLNIANCIELDKDKIKAEITSKGSYEEKGVKLKHWEGEADSEFYVGSLQKNKYSYLGVLNPKLRRQNFGVNHYDNGDVYFGFFENDVKAKHGCYFYAPTVEKGIVNSEVYYGFWRDNQKDHHGIYIWLSERKGNTNFDEADFDAFVGDVELDEIRRGTYLTKIADNYFVYFGNYDAEGRKNDDNGFFYSSKQDRVFKGKIVNDRFTQGHLVYFDENGAVINILYVELNNNDEPTKITKYDEMADKDKKDVGNDATTFRNILIDEDYFGMIYQKLKEASDLVENKMKDIAILDDFNGYPKLMKVGAAYNDIKINVKLSKAFPGQ
jgi:hypothetical protein